MIGGNDKYIDPSSRHEDSEIIRSDGSTCVPSSGSPIPNLPKSLKNFALASRKDRYIYLCGGNYLTYTGREYSFFYIHQSNMNYLLIITSFHYTLPHQNLEPDGKIILNFFNYLPFSTHSLIIHGLKFLNRPII